MLYRLAEVGHLPLALLVVHAAMYLRDLAGEAQPIQALDQRIEGIAVFGEDNHLFLFVIWIEQHLAQLLKFRLASGFVHLSRKLTQPGHLRQFRL